MRDLMDLVWCEGKATVCDVSTPKYTRCLTRKMAGKDGDSDESIRNIMMKVGFERGGINHTVASAEDRLKPRDTIIFRCKCEFVGLGRSFADFIQADVIPAGPGSYPGCSAIAAIGGLVEYTAGKCQGSMRLQAVEEKGVEVTD